MIHDSAHPLAGHRVRVVTERPLFHQAEGEQPFVVEDWYDRVHEVSWIEPTGEPAVLDYAVRSSVSGLPIDDEVVYGHTDDGLDHLVHTSEIVTDEDTAEAAAQASEPETAEPETTEADQAEGTDALTEAVA